MPAGARAVRKAMEAQGFTVKKVRTVSFQDLARASTLVVEIEAPPGPEYERAKEAADVLSQRLGEGYRVIVE